MCKKLGGVVVMVGLLIWTGCGQGASDEEPDPEPQEETGVTVVVSFDDVMDVEGFDYAFRDCEDDQVVAEVSSSVGESEVTGEAPELVDVSVGDASDHQFVEHFQEVPEGCYDIEVRPVTDSEAPSADCSGVSASEVFVVSDKTTEVVLSSKCDGTKMGAGDVIAALNQPPVIESIDYEPSKFVHECEAAYICVTAYDPDGDPMEFEFEQTAGQQLRFDLEVTEPEIDGKRATSCMRAVPLWNDDYEFEVSVYDQFHDDGQTLRVDELSGGDSSDTMTFPLYSNWDIELECYDEETGLFHHFKGVREVERASQDGEQCIPIWPEEYYCSDYHWDETEYTCPDGEFKPETVYPRCGDIDSSKYESEGRELGEERW